MPGTVRFIKWWLSWCKLQHGLDFDHRHDLGKSSIALVNQFCMRKGNSKFVDHLFAPLSSCPSNGSLFFTYGLHWVMPSKVIDVFSCG